jgi:DNA-binding protein Fis
MKMLDQHKKKLLVIALKTCNGDKKLAAEMMGIHVRTLRNWELKFGLREKAPKFGNKRWQDLC